MSKKKIPLRWQFKLILCVLGKHKWHTIHNHNKGYNKGYDVESACSRCSARKLIETVNL